MQETHFHAFLANCFKQDLRTFSPGIFLQKKSATWKAFVFSASDYHTVVYHDHHTGVHQDYHTVGR